MNAEFRKQIETVIANYQRISHLECYYMHGQLSEAMIGRMDTNCKLCQLFCAGKNGHSECKSLLSSGISSAIRDDSWKIIVCRTGMLDWVVPVFYNGTPVGFLISGFVCNSEISKQKILSQTDLFFTNYSIVPAELQEACGQLQVVQKEQVRFFARLLYDLCRIHIPSGKERLYDNHLDPRKTIFFETDDETLRDLPKNHPLSQFVYSSTLSSHTMEIFWKSIELKAASIFANIMSKRILEAHILYNEVMNMAYCEPTLLHMKTSAEVLYHIITLTRYNKEAYDVRFYYLTFTTMQKVIEADSPDKVREVMDDAFNTMCSYCVADPQVCEQSPVVLSVIEFLEKNYQYPIKMEDVAKHVHMSPAYISRLFKRETNTTIKGWLNSIRMKQAQKLLLETDIPIKDIGLAVGYEDMRGFYKMFAKHFGVTCSDVRKNAPVE